MAPIRCLHNFVLPQVAQTLQSLEHCGLFDLVRIIANKNVSGRGVRLYVPDSFDLLQQLFDLHRLLCRALDLGDLDPQPTIECMEVGRNTSHARAPLFVEGFSYLIPLIVQARPIMSIPQADQLASCTSLCTSTAISHW